jgi:hypothetical protein
MFVVLYWCSPVSSHRPARRQQVCLVRSSGQAGRQHAADSAAAQRRQTGRQDGRHAADRKAQAGRQEGVGRQAGDGEMMHESKTNGLPASVSRLLSTPPTRPSCGERNS